jgi:hypothetical protein
VDKNVLQQILLWAVPVLIGCRNRPMLNHP